MYNPKQKNMNKKELSKENTNIYNQGLSKLIYLGRESRYTQYLKIKAEDVSDIILNYDYKIIDKKKYHKKYELN
jgi:hypothetical protein